MDKKLKVICVNYGHKSPLATGQSYIKEGEIYTVKSEPFGFSNYAQRMVEAYEFYEIDGYYEKGMFIPISGIDELEFDRALKILLKTKPLRIKKKTPFRVQI